MNICLKMASALTVMGLGIAGCTGPDSPAEGAKNPDALSVLPSDPGPEVRPFPRVDYDDLDTWLCHPDKETDECDTDLTTTVIQADGTTTIEAFTQATEPSFDCFYIYPTVSFDITPNSDLNIGIEERNVVHNQFARFGSLCRTFAPVYRQRTLADLNTLLTTGQSPADLDMRYADVIDAWNHYLANHNEGRGVLLIGHSQGADMIFELLRKDLAPGAPARDLIIAYYAIGFTQWLDPETGAFEGLPPCASTETTGCLVNFESYRATIPPPSDAWFGVNQGNNPAICTDPTLLSGSDGELLAYMPRKSMFQPQPFDFGVPVETPFVRMPALISGACTSNETHTWLKVTTSDATDGPRVDDIVGDYIRPDGSLLEAWGLHLVDMNISMGNLLIMAERQAAAWQKARN